VEKLLDDWKKRVNAIGLVYLTLLSTGIEADEEVFLDSEMREDFAALRDIAEAKSRAIGGSGAVQGRTFELNAAGIIREQAHERFEGCAFPHSIAAHQAEDSFGADGQIDAAQDGAAANGDPEIGYRQAFGL
jgi:hypothetical protein